MDGDFQLTYYKDVVLDWLFSKYDPNWAKKQKDEIDSTDLTNMASLLGITNDASLVKVLCMP